MNEEKIKAVVSKVKALSALPMKTTRAQNALLQTLSDTELAFAAEILFQAGVYREGTN